MKGYAMLKIGESGWIEKDSPACGPMDAICTPTGSCHLHLGRPHPLGRRDR